MRSVWFSLIGPSIAEVEAAIEAHGFFRPENSPEELRYPSVDEPVLYVKCDDYQWVESYDLHEEYSDLLGALGNATPTVQVTADVSGRVPGDVEVKFLTRLLLSTFRGFAFDDFLAYSHAWTLQEVEKDAIFNGLHFFDYKGSWMLQQSRSRKNAET